MALRASIGRLGTVRATHSAGPICSQRYSRTNERRSVMLRRALPVPESDIISDDGLATVLSLEERFRMADLDGNGRIDREELRVLLESVEGGLAYPLLVAENWLPEEALDAAMEKYDKDKSGDIDFEEFKQLLYDGLVLDGAVQEYEAAFRAVDDSGNGSVGATELAQLFKSLGTPLSMERLAEVFMRFDKDQSGQIEFGEFLAMFQEQLLDLKRVQAWLAKRDAAASSAAVSASMDATPWDESATGSLLETVAGDVSVIFGQQEMEEVLTKHKDKLVVLFCGLTWCRPCKGVAKPYERLAAAYSESCVFLKLYGNANPSCKDLFKTFRIRSTPSFLFFRDGQIIGSCSGANKGRLEDNLRSHLSTAEMPSQRVYEPQPAAA